MAFEVWAQADVVVARLTVEPATTAGWLETTLLEAIGTGMSSPFDLADVFGLAPSLVLNILGDLWRAGRISFEDADADRESLMLTSSGKAVIGRNDQVAETTAQTTATEELVVERLTGRVLPARFAARRPPPQDADLVVPPLPTDTESATITIDDLRDALATAIETNRAGLGTKYRDKRVRSASWQPPQLQNSAHRRYVRIGVTAHRSDIDELTVAVVDPYLTLRERELATRYLQAALDGAPRSNFANRVRERASRVPLKPQGIDRAVQELHDAIDAMPTCLANTRQQRHDQAAHLATQIATYAGSLAAQEMQIETITSASDHRTALNELIGSASSQVVIAVPWIRVKGLEAIRDSLLHAVNRGVQVILIWGIDGNANGLETSEASWLDSISAHISRSGARGKLLYSRDRGSRNHAKLAIADDRRMMVSSMNFLSISSHTEVGVVLTAMNDLQCPAISAALQYAYDKAPTPRIAYSLNRVPGAFGARSTPDASHVVPPRFTKALTEEGTPAGIIRAWAAAWAECVDELTKLLSRPNPTVELIADLQHRGVLRNALTDATRRVLVTSDKLTDTALNEDIVALARTRAREGLPVRFKYRSANDEGRARVDVLLGAADDQQAPVDVDRSASMHAKIVLRDDRILLGSFNPLSVDADLRQRRSTGELGVDIRSSEVADLVWSAITGEVPGARATANEQPGKAEPGHPHAAVAQELFEALEDASLGPVLVVVRRIGFDEAFTAYTSFSSEPIGMTRVAAAGLLADLEQGHAVSASATALLRQQLKAGNWGVARLLFDHADHVDLPTRQFIESLDGGCRSGEALLYAEISDADLASTEYEALAVVDAVALLLGDAAAADSDAFFDATTRYPTTESRDFLEAVTTYLHRYSVLPPSPPADAEVEAKRIAAAWSEASEAVSGFKRYDPKLESGYAFQKHVFGPSGEMSVLEDALARRSADEINAWFASHVLNRHDDKWFDRATRAAGLGKITDSRRQSFVMWRGKVRKAVQHLGEALRGAPEQQVLWDADQSAHVERLLDCARRLHAARSGSDLIPEIITATELERLLEWSSRRAVPAPPRDWKASSFVKTSRATEQDSVAYPHALLTAVAEDLGAVLNHAEVITELARGRQFARARELTARLGTTGSLENEEASDLSREVDRLRNEAVHELAEQIDELRLSNEHAGVESETGLAPHIDPEDEDLRDALAEIKSYQRKSESAIAKEKARITAQFERDSDGMADSWREYVEDLINAGEFVLAQQALRQHNGNTELPRPRPFARWSWAHEDISVVAGWFLNDGEGAPPGMRERFFPAVHDAPGRALVAALQSLSAAHPDLGAWVSAVHRLVNDDDEYDTLPEVVSGDGYTLATLRLPYSERLPRLRWADGDPVTIAVGSFPVPDTLLRLSTSMSRSVAEDPVVDVADLLSLLAHRDGTGAPALLDRKLQFLSVVCSRLPLEDVIDPNAMPARLTESGRKQLAWLLSTIGVRAEAAEVDRLRIWAGGHGAVLWALIDAARNDHSRGISGLLDRTARHKALMRGIEMDLGHEEDILMLAIGVLGALEQGCTLPALMGAFEDEWTQSCLIPHRLRLADVIARLISKGYVVQEGEVLRSCGCAASRALADAATREWMSDRMDAVDPSRFIEARAFDFILERIRHDQQAAGQILDKAGLREKARVSLQQRLNGEPEFDLAELCARMCRDYRSKNWDLEFTSPGGPILVNSVGPKVWVELLVAELLNNAVEAVRGLPVGQGTIWITLDFDDNAPEIAVLRIHNNGSQMPTEIAEAFIEGRIVRRTGRTDRGTGLVSFKRFGETHGVILTLERTPTDQTVVECRMPLKLGD